MRFRKLLAVNFYGILNTNKWIHHHPAVRKVTKDEDDRVSKHLRDIMVLDSAATTGSQASGNHKTSTHKKGLWVNPCGKLYLGTQDYENLREDMQVQSGAVVGAAPRRCRSPSPPPPPPPPTPPHPTPPPGESSAGGEGEHVGYNSTNFLAGESWRGKLPHKPEG